MKKKYLKPQMNTYNMPRFSLLAESNPAVKICDDEEIYEDGIL